ncbi:MAG: thioredoxin family protein [Chitinophagaceae bacterium]|nr:thioredoxin family protein [Chitinophagaceae bacterium]
MSTNTANHPLYQTGTHPETGEKIYLGSIRRSDIDVPEFPFFAEGQAAYTNVSADAVEALKNNKDKIHLIIFMGTWCEDSHVVIPGFYKLVDASGFPEERIAMFAVDQNKELPNHLPQAMNVHNVPTIIVMENGKEKGRLIEFGASGKWDQELTNIINS